MDGKLNGKSRADTKSLCDVLLSQSVVRHPDDEDLHSVLFEQYFLYMRALAKEMGFYSLVTNGVPTPPNNLLSLAAYLRNKNLNVSVADLNLSYLSRGSDPQKELVERLKRDKPKILGLSAMESYLMDSVIRLAETAKRFDPQLLIVMGGVNATAMANKILQKGAADVIVRGEGEVIFAELCKVFLNQGSLCNVKGISYIQGNKLVMNPDMPLMDLNELPLPARDLYHLKEMYDMNGGIDAVYASRGCPYKCLFCNGPSFWRSRWRGRDPDSVVDELDYIQHKGGKVAFLYDMNFGFSREWALDLCKKIREAGIEIIWGCELRINDLQDKKFLAALYKARCRSIFTGIESVDQNSLSGVKKGYFAEKIDEALSNAAKVGLGVEATVMIGMPDDTRESIQHTTEKMIALFREELVKLVHYFLCIPWPGTELGNYPERYCLNVVCKNHRNFITAPSVPIASTKYLSADETYSLWQDGLICLLEEVKKKLLMLELQKNLVT